MWYEILESGIFIFMNPESSNVYTSWPKKGYDFLCISKKEYEFMLGSQQPISMWDSIKVQDKTYYMVYTCLCNTHE